MTVQTYSANSHDRFQNNAAFIGNPYDWSGVGRGTAGRWGVMISDSYFLSANHFAPSGTLRFYYSNDPSGSFEDATIDSGVQIGTSDLWLGKLDNPVSSSVAKYPILALPSVSNYENRTIFTFGLTGGSPGGPTTVRLGRNQIDPGTIALYNAGTNAAYQFDWDNPTGGVGADESYLATGDSGGPSFNLALGSIPALTGIHWAVATLTPPPYISLDTFVPYYINAIQNEMDGEFLTLIPEPSTMALMVVGGSWLVVAARRRRQFAA